MIARLNDVCFDEPLTRPSPEGEGMFWPSPGRKPWSPPAPPLAGKPLPKFMPLGSKPAAAAIPPQGAFLFSLVVPGAGQFCLGQYFIGILFLVMAIGCWLVRFFVPDLDFNFMLWAVHLVPASAAWLTAQGEEAQRSEGQSSV